MQFLAIRPINILVV